METKEFTKNKKLISLLTIFCIIINLFAPYSVLAAGTPAAGEPYLEVKLHPIIDISDYADPDDIPWDDDTGNYYFEYYNEANVSTVENPEDGTIHIVTVDVILKGKNTVNAAGFNISYDTSVLIPGDASASGRGSRKTATANQASDLGDFTSVTWTDAPANSLNTSISQMRLEGYTTGKFSNGQVLATMTFILAPGKTFADITEDVFTLAPASGLDTGLLICDNPSGSTIVEYKDSKYWQPVGFAASTAVTATALTVVNPMNKVKYYHGENLDLTGASVKIEYSDGTDETISLTQALSDGKVSIDSREANRTTNKSVLTAGDVTADLNYTVAKSIAVGTNPQTNYTHGDSLVFTGGDIIVTYYDNSTEVLSMTNSKFTKNRTRADVDNPTVTFKYIDPSLTTTLNLTVADPLDRIEVQTQPTSTTYNHGDAISGVGGTIKAITKSGKITSGISMTDSSVTLSPSTASINSCTSTWKNGDLDAGSQAVTVTYTNAASETKSTTFNIVVNDTVTGIAKKSDVTAKNKYGAGASSLVYTGAQITVTTGSGSMFDVNVNSGMVDTSSYNPNTLATQNLPVTYAGFTTAANAGIDLSLSNYINGITVSTSGPVVMTYGDALDLTGVTYTKDYADGTHSSPIAVTSSMVTGYNPTPGASTFNASHESNETLTVTLSTPDDATLDVVPQSDTFTAKVKDKVTSISLNTYPTKVTYKYGDSFDPAGGRISLTYASGVTGSTLSMTATGVSITEQDGTAINMSPNGSDFGSTHRVNKTLKVTYNDGTTTFTGVTIPILIKDILTGASITTPPTTTFNHGDTFSVGSGKITLTFQSSNVDVRDLDDGTTIVDRATNNAVNMSPAYSAFDSNNETTKNLRVSYTEDGVTKYDDYSIKIINNITGIAVTTPPDTLYNIGDTAYTNLSNGVVTITRAVGPTATVAMDDPSVSLTPLSTLTSSVGTQNVTVEYQGLTNTFEITVANGPKSIAITAPTDVTFDHGDALTFGGGSIVVTYADNSTNSVTITNAMVTETLTGTSVDMSPSATAYDATTHSLTKNLTLSYTEGPITETVNYDITLNNPVDSLAFGTAPKNSYNLNETPTYPDGTIIGTRKAGDSDAAVNITADMVSGLDTTTAGTGKTATVAYGGISTTYNYDVFDYVTGITITAPSKTNYNHGDPLDLTGGTITVTYAGAAPSHPAMTTAMITDGTAAVNMSPAYTDYTNNVISKTLTITYTENGVTETISYPITITNNVTGIAVTTEPDTTYNIGATAYTGLSTGDILVTRAVGPTEVVTMDDPDVSLTPLNTLSGSVGTGKTVTVTYEGQSDTFNISIVNGVKSITITPPTDDTFEHGDTLTYGGGSILVTYADNSTNTVAITNAMVTESGAAVNMSPSASDYNATTHTLTKTLTVTYTEDGVTQTEDYTITLVNPIDSISIGTSPKTSYNLNETPTYPDGTIIPLRKAGDSDAAVNITAAMVSGLDTTSAGTGKTATVAYSGVTTTYSYDVLDYVTGITIVPPTKTNYNYGDPLDVTGGLITVSYAAAPDSNPAMTTAMITEGTAAVNMSPAYADFTNNVLTKTLTITYTENGVTQTESYTITINNNITGIAMGTNPTDTTYELNDTTYKLAGGDIIVTRAVGPVETVALTDSGIGLTELSTLTNTSGTKQVTVTYEGQTTSFDIEVQDAFTSIEIVGTPKTNYEVGEALDSTLSIIAHRASGDVTIPVTSSMISGFSTAAEGNGFVAIITYEGLQTNYTYNVTDDIVSIAMDTTPKTNYLVGDTLDVTGGTITVTKKSGATETVNIAPTMVSGFDSTAEVTGQTLTVEYQGLQTTYQINVTDPINSITLNPGPNKTIYKYGEGLDLTGAYIDIVKENGTTDRKEVTSSMVSGYDPTTLGTQTVTVTYGKDLSGNDVTTTFTVEVQDYVTGIAVKNAKTNYNYGEALDLTVGSVELTMASSTPATDLDLDDPVITVSGYSATTVGTQTLTVTYGTISTTYEVEVKDYVANTSIIVPTKTTYNYGDSLDLSTGKIVQTMASGDTNDLPLANSMVTEADGTPVDMTPSSFDSTNKVQKTLKITSDGITENYPIEIVNDVKSITIKQTPKQNYQYGDTIDTSVGSIEVTRGNGQKEEILLSDPRISIDGFDTTTPLNNIPVTVKFTENGVTKQTTYTIDVNDDISSIQLVGTPKTTYKYGESLDLSGLTLTVVRPSGTTPNVPVTANMVSGYNPNQLGNQTITITYGDKQEQFIVEIQDYLKDIELIKPTKVTYKVGETLDLTGASITEVMASGAKVTGVAVTQSMVSSLDTTTEGAKTLTVTYTKDEKTFNKQFVVVVQDALSGITVKDFPVDEYLYGEALDLTGATIEVELESGEKEIILITSSMVSGYTVKPSEDKFDDSDEYIQVITISYTKDGKTETTTYPVTMKDYLDGIVVENLQDEYKYGEALNVEGATVAKVMASGKTKDEVQLTKDMVSGYDPYTEGNQTLTITYAGETANEVVTVVDNVVAISIKKTPNKTTYDFGEGLDLTGAKLNVVKYSGVYVIDITEDMISGYNPEEEGTQTVTVNYEGFEAEFSVKVLEKPETPVSDDTPDEPSTPVTPSESRVVTRVVTVVDQPEKTEETKVEEQPKTQEPVVKTTTKTPTVKTEIEKPTQTLGVKDEQENNGLDIVKVIAGMIAILGLLVLLFLLFFKHNVKIYVEEDGEFVLGGLDNISKNNPTLDIDKYLDDETYPNRVKVHLNDSISDRLDGIEIELTHRGQTIKHKVHYEDEPYEFILDAISKVDEKETK